MIVGRTAVFGGDGGADFDGRVIGAYSLLCEDLNEIYTQSSHLSRVRQLPATPIGHAPGLVGTDVASSGSGAVPSWSAAATGKSPHHAAAMARNTMLRASQAMST